MDEPRASETTGWRRWSAIGALVGVCALAALPFVCDAKSEGRVPDGAETTAAAEAIRAQFQDGDAVWVEPSWWALPRHVLEDMGEGTEAWPFPALLVSEEIDPVEALGHRRLFVMAGFGREPGLPRELEGAEATRAEVFASERVAVARWDFAGTMPRLRTLTKEWAALEVTRRYGVNEAPVVCKVRGEKHRCGRDGWQDVALEDRVVMRREVRWLFVHPGPIGSVLELAWKGLERTTAAGHTWLYVRIGPTMGAVRQAEGKPVDVEVLVDDVPIDAFELAPHRFWMERRAIALPAGAGDARVTFRIWSAEPAWRETVLEADLLADLPAPLRRWATHVVD